MDRRATWLLGMSFVLAVALIWVLASFVVQFVESQGVPSFLFTYICNSLFVLYLPLTELARCLSRTYRSWRAVPARQELAPASPSEQCSLERQQSTFKFDLWRRVSFSSTADDETTSLVEEHHSLLAKDHTPSKDPSDFVDQRNCSPGSFQRPQGKHGETDGRLPVTQEGPLLADAGDFSPRSGKASSPKRRNWLAHNRSPALNANQHSAVKGTQAEGSHNDVLTDDELQLSEVDIFDDRWSPQRPRHLVKRCGERYRAAAVGLIVAPLWFLAQYTFNLSLHYTSVTSNTILSSASSLFTFLLSVLWLGEPFSWFKLAMVGLCMLGTAIVSLADSSTPTAAPNSPPTHSLEGDLLCVVSALIYATYTVTLRHKMPEEEGVREGEEEGEHRQEQLSTGLVLGFVGLFGALLLWPVILVLHWTGLERVHGLTEEQFSMVIGKGLLDNVLSDYLWVRAVLLTTPTAATAGLSVQIPVAIAADFLVKGSVPGPLLLLGGTLVLVGFLGINLQGFGCCKSVENDAEQLHVPSQRSTVGGGKASDGGRQTHLTPLQRIVCTDQTL